MKVNISEIPKAGLFLEEISTGKDLDLGRKDLEFNDPVKMKAAVNREYDNVLIHLSVEACGEFLCGRCLEPGNYSVKKEIDIIRPLSDGKVIDITKIARDEIILDYPLKLLCKVDCKGICAGCGNNLNKRQCVCSKEDDSNRGIEID
ncbi:MAG: DUF177 domain-containing protein [Candidatus Omnitrophica bacterium]|nr:DUF177 domain-containing protein [Candidatus Omnitrophota bacterium]